MTVMTEAGTAPEKGHFFRNYGNKARNRSTSHRRPRSGSRASTNWDKNQGYKCRKYNHFARDCPTSREKKGN